METSESPRLRRRQILDVMLAAACLWVLRPLEALGGLLVHREVESPITRRLIGIYKHKRSARIIGQEYLATCPEEANRTVLGDGILSGEILKKADATRATDQALARLVTAQVEKDFECGRTVKVHGWILSLTEVRLCALLAICG